MLLSSSSFERVLDFGFHITVTLAYTQPTEEKIEMTEMQKTCWPNVLKLMNVTASGARLTPKAYACNHHTLLLVC